MTQSSCSLIKKTTSLFLSFLPTFSTIIYVFQKPIWAIKKRLCALKHFYTLKTTSLTGKSTYWELITTSYTKKTTSYTLTMTSYTEKSTFYTHISAKSILCKPLKIYYLHPIWVQTCLNRVVFWFTRPTFNWLLIAIIPPQVRVTLNPH